MIENQNKILKNWIEFLARQNHEKKPEFSLNLEKFRNKLKDGFVEQKNEKDWQ